MSFILSDEASCITLGGVWGPPDTSCTVTNLTIDSGRFFTIKQPVRLYVKGIVNNYGTIVNSAITVLSGHESIVNNYGNFTNHNFLELDSDGSIDNYGDFHNVASIYNSGFINNYGMFRNKNYLINYNVMTNKVNGIIRNTDLLWNNNAGILYNHGTINNILGGNLVNVASGIIDNFGTINNRAYFNLYSGIANHHGTVVNEVSATINNVGGHIIMEYPELLKNYGVVRNQGVLEGNGIVRNICLGRLTNADGSFVGDNDITTIECSLKRSVNITLQTIVKMELDSEIANNLITELNSTLNALKLHENNSAKEHLQVFIEKVASDSGSKIPDDQANRLISAANKIQRMI